MIKSSMKRSVVILGHIIIYSLVGLYLSFPAQVPIALSTTFFFCLIWISVVDFDRFEISDGAVGVLVAAGILYVSFWSDITIWDHVLGAVLWPLLFLSVAQIFLKSRGFDGLGFGDVKLIGALGLWCGFVGTINLVLAASVAGALTLVIFSVLRGKRSFKMDQSAVAFGPFLCLSAWAVWLQGQLI